MSARALDPHRVGAGERLGGVGVLRSIIIQCLRAARWALFPPPLAACATRVASLTTLPLLLAAGAVVDDEAVRFRLGSGSPVLRVLHCSRRLSRRPALPPSPSPASISAC